MKIDLDHQKKLIITIIVSLLAIGGIAFFIYKKNYSPKTEQSSMIKKEKYYCSMHPSIQANKPGICPICHMDLQKVNEETEETQSDSDSKLQKKAKKILLYRHPMRPDITSKTPAKDEMGMDYIPVYEEEMQDSREHEESTPSGRASFTLSIEKQQLIGVTSTVVQKQKLYTEVRASGRVAFDPELFTAIEEYKQAILSSSQMSESEYGSLKEQARALVESAKTRLKLLGLGDEHIRALSRNEKAAMSLILPKGSAWIYAEVFEYEVQGIREGAEIEAETPSIPGKIFKGKLSSISPVVNAPSRTVRIRALVPDPHGSLRPDTFLNVKIKMDFGERLAVPEDSVLYSGEQAFVFILKGKGKFEPRLVRIGLKTPDFHEVLSGVSEGEKIVTAANFLIDSESKLKGVLKMMGKPPSSSSKQDSSSPSHQHGGGQ